jgi:hypothetical protein
MRKETNDKYKRYKGDKFEEAQCNTLELRKKVLPALGLQPGEEDWLEMPIKPKREGVQALDEIQAVKNLLLVHYIERKGEKVPPHILALGRGTIVYTIGEKYFIVRQSIPYTYDIELNSISVNEGKCSFTVPVPLPLNMKKPNEDEMGSKTFTVPVENLHISPYIEGTVIDIMKIDGKVQWFTSHNLLPKGLIYQEKSVYKPARWAEHHIPFTKSMEEIIKAVDPNLLKDNMLFPENCLISNKLYRFVLLTRERVRAESMMLGEKGILVYLGCITQFQYSEMDEVGIKYGVADKSLPYEPKCETSIPKDTTRPFILRFESSMTIDQANNYLRGNENIPHPLSGGGKLVVRANVVNLGEKRTLTFHVKSDSYSYREKVLGNTDNLYKRFVDIMDLGDYYFEDEISVAEYYRDFPNVAIPGVLGNVSKQQNKTDLRAKQKNEISELKYEVNNYMVLVPKFLTRRPKIGAPESPRAHIWYIFLLCANISIRPTVLRYLERYSKDIDFMVDWLFRKLDPKSNFDFVADNPSEKKKADKNKDFVLKYKMEISRHELYQKGRGINTVLLLKGDKAAKAISIARHQTGTMKESFKISEAEERLPTYADITERVRR